MTLIVRDAQFNFVTEIPAYCGRRGGYAKPVAQLDVEGGLKGMEFELPRYPKSLPARLQDGFLVEWWKHDRQIYAGKVVAGPDDRADSWGLTLKGVASDWMDSVPADYTTGASKKASEIIATLVSSYGPGALLSTATTEIATSSYVIANSLAYSKQTIGSIIEEVNAFEGWEFGDFYPRPGHSIIAKPYFYYRAPDNTTQHYVVDVRTLAERPTLKLDKENFGNKIRTYYGTGTSYNDTNGTADSQTRHGIVWYKIDISGTNTSSADATQAANTLLGGLKVDGVEQPPVTTDLVLDYSTRLRGVSGAMSAMHSINPGQNILLTGIGELARNLDAVNNHVFVKIKTVKREENKVHLSCNKGYDLGVLLARLKKQVA